MNKVKVTADQVGNVIVLSKTNPEYGYIRVEQVRMLIDDNGFARKKTISALIPGKIEDLKAFGWEAGQEVDGKVIFKESLNPFNEKESERDYKIAGATKVVCSVEGKPIYRKTFYSPNVSAEDVYIRDEYGNVVSHDNKEAIKAAYAAIKTSDETANAEAEISKL